MCLMELIINWVWREVYDDDMMRRYDACALHGTGHGTGSMSALFDKDSSGHITRVLPLDDLTEA